jgi:uncharacterized protein DUF1553/uncharacterized protein DUF1549/cytochrome c
MLLAVLAIAALCAVECCSLLADDDANAEFFEKSVRPILAARCYECHSAQPSKPKGGLRLDVKAAAMKGGDSGPAIVPGSPKQSLLIDAINYGQLYQMPPKTKLPADEIATLTKWIDRGAPWPDDVSIGDAAVRPAEFDLQQRKANHWCWQPIKAASPPPVKNESWPRQPLDSFILSGLEQQGVSPARQADYQTLLRRAYFDLLGLPPVGSDVEQALAGGSESDYVVLIDRLLASPQFGERWARHWLDLVRYAESRGHEFDYNIPNAFEYRDYVVRALNADLSYDQFVVEHIAGDLLNQPRLNAESSGNESIIGTGFWFLGEWCHSPVDIRKDECDRLDNMLDVFSKTFLGITVACARCHDHKFDAISQRDYYALAGFLQSSSYGLARFEAWQSDKNLAERFAALDDKYRPQMATALASSISRKAGDLARALALANVSDSELAVWNVDPRGADLIIDYNDPPLGGWMTDGPTFGVGPLRDGHPWLTGNLSRPLQIATYGAAVRDPNWGELGIASFSENDSGKLGGWLRAGRTLKTPTWTLKSGKVHYFMQGAGHVYAVVDSHAMINGPLHGQLLKDVGSEKAAAPSWVTHDLSAYAGQRVHLEFSPKQDADLRVMMVVDGPERPGLKMRPNALLQKAQESHEASVACKTLITATLGLLTCDGIAADFQPRDRAAIANWLLSHADSGELQPLVASYVAERDKLKAQIRRDSRVCLAMWDGSAVDENLLMRGNPKTAGPVVPRRGPEALQAEGAADAKNRLELARELVDTRNPLVSRVIVNRVWQHLMGRGIAPSVDNFGVLGQQPTHPELLDYLAAEFMRDGWSIKRLIRRITLSSTYRQQSLLSNSNREAADPQNLLFHRQNIKRLEGEVVRDSILAISGRLNGAMYGPSVPIHLTSFMQGRGRPKDSGPLDGDGRRSLYLATRRNFLSPMMLAFDTPIPFTTIGQRHVSNVPSQALTLMNDPFFADQSQLWARSLMADRNMSANGRIHAMYLAAFGREPTAHEISAAGRFLAEQAREYGLASAGEIRDERVWADFCHVLFNTKEFLLVN